MQNQPNRGCRLEYLPYDLPHDFPVIAFSHSPSSETVSFLHFHNCIELGYCYEGCGIFFVNDKVLPFSAGDVCIIFKNEIHIAQSDRFSTSKWQFAMIDPVLLLPDLNINDLKLISNVTKGCSSFLNIINKNDPHGIAKLVLEIFAELNNQENGYRSMVKSLAWALMVKLSRVFGNHDGNRKDDATRDVFTLIAPALDHISKNYMEQLYLKELALRCKISVTHFRRLFSTVMRTSPSKYICLVRIRMASILLLNTDLSILDISMNVGYATLSSFNRNFKKVMGVTPREWRKQDENKYHRNR